MVDSIDSWIVDSGATDHVCNTLQGFKETRKFASEEFTLRLGDGSIVEARAMGDVILNFDDFRFLEIKNCYYIPVFKRNLISVSCLMRQGYSVHFDNKVSIRKNKSLICTGTHRNNLFFIQPKSISLHNLENDSEHVEP